MTQFVYALWISFGINPMTRLKTTEKPNNNRTRPDDWRNKSVFHKVKRMEEPI